MSSIAEKLQIIAENEQKVYNAGYEKGKAEGGSYYDDFWDAFQNNGTRTDYGGAFSNGWNDEAFNPKYDLIISSAGSMFRNSGITQLAKKLKDKGLKFDTSQLTGAGAVQMFQSAKIKDVPVVDLSNVTYQSHTFSYSNIETIERVILGDKVTSVGSPFVYMIYLKHCIFDGVLAFSGLDLKDSKLLDKESITSLINILSTTTSGLSVTLSLTAVNKAFETSEGANNGSTSTEWQTLENSKQNWTINLS